MEKWIANGVIFLCGQNVIRNVEEVCNIVKDLLNCWLAKVGILAKENLEKKEVATIVNVHALSIAFGRGMEVGAGVRLPVVTDCNNENEKYFNRLEMEENVVKELELITENALKSNVQLIASGIALVNGLNVAPHVVKDYKDDKEPFEQGQAMVVDNAEEVKHNLEIVIMDLARSTVYGQTLDHGVNVVIHAGSEHDHVNDSLLSPRRVPMGNPAWVRQQKIDLAMKNPVLPQLKNQVPQL